MSEPITIDLLDGEDEGLTEIVDTILTEAARGLDRAFDGRKVHLRARDPDGRVLGGLVGAHIQHWFYVKLLGVAPEARNMGVGAQLLARAEDVAREAGLVGIYLDTFDFQAPRFYTAQGFREIGRLPKLGEAPQRIWFVKEFTDSGSKT